MINKDLFLRGYIEAALWSSTDEEGRPLDDSADANDLSPECALAMRSVCEDFIDGNADDLALYCEKMYGNGFSAEEKAGHDFWLTRNRHGAGFWDRGLGELGDRLSDAAKVYGGVDLYYSDEMIHGETL